MAKKESVKVQTPYGELEFYTQLHWTLKSKWWWRLTGNNNEICGGSHEGFATLQGARGNLELNHRIIGESLKVLA